MEDRQRTLISKRDMEDLRERWTSVQSSFVDDPKNAVKAADQLVSNAIEQLSESFRAQRAQLEKRTGSGELSTEDLRIALQQYRMFFDRLLAL